MTTTETGRVEWLAVLAGAYVSLDGNLLDHAVARTALTLGRVRRAAGEVLCRRVSADSLADVANEQPVKCPRCAKLAARL